MKTGLVRQMQNCMPVKSKFLLSAAVFVITGSTTVAQTPAAAPMTLGPVTVQGSFRSRLEVWDWFQGEANNSYAFSGNLLRLSFGQTRKTFDWQIELAAPILLGLPDDAVAAGNQGQLGLGATYYVANDASRNAGMVFPKQAFIRWKHRAHSLRFGRFEFSDGAETTPADGTLAWMKRERIAQRIIGPFGWTHVGRSYDGAHYVWNTKTTNFTFVGALPTRGVFQTDGWGNLNVGIGYAALTHAYGGKKNSGDLRVFGIYYQDWRSVVKTDNRPLAVRRGDLANIRVGAFGGHLLHRVATDAGPVDLLFWGVAQTGKWGRLDHRAGSWVVEGGWQPTVLPRLKPWIRAGYSHSSGDKDPADGRHGTYFQMLPTPRPYARFPFFDMVNNEDISGMLILRPHKQWTVRSEVHGLRLSSGSDLWYLGGGAFQPWTFGYTGRTTNGARGLATLYDVSADYAVTPQVTLTGYYGHAQGHSVMRNVYPRGKNGNFGYIELLYRF